MEVAKEKSRARHSWLYQAEEEFEKVDLGPLSEQGAPRQWALCLGVLLTLIFPHVITEAER